MSKTRYTLRFYPHHDLDLVTFMTSHDFSVTSAAYSALSAFVRGELFAIDVPEIEEKPNSQGEVKRKRVYRKSLVLDTEKDAAVIALLDSINEGYRNCFIKHLLRLYLCYPFSPAFLNENAPVNVPEMFAVFRKDRRVVKAGKRRRTATAGKKAEGPETPGSADIQKPEAKEKSAEGTEQKPDMTKVPYEAEKAAVQEQPESDKAISGRDTESAETEEEKEEKKEKEEDQNDAEDDVFGLFESINSGFMR